MRYERKYEFLEEFLEWNFRRLPKELKEKLYGSPSFALHMWLNLSRMEVKSSMSVVLFESSYHTFHKNILESFLNGTGFSLYDVPAHFVTTIHDEKLDVHFDLKGDITGGKNRIAFIRPLNLDKEKIGRLISHDRLPKCLHNKEVNALRTVMNRMQRSYVTWHLSSKMELWKEFSPYHKVLASLGDKPKRVKRPTRSMLNKKP